MRQVYVNGNTIMMFIITLFNILQNVVCQKTFTLPTGAVAKYCDEYVCVCVCVCLSVYPHGYLRNHMRNIYQNIYACCL